MLDTNFDKIIELIESRKNSAYRKIMLLVARNIIELMV